MKKRDGGLNSKERRATLMQQTSEFEIQLFLVPGHKLPGIEKDRDENQM